MADSWQQGEKRKPRKEEPLLANKKLTGVLS